MSKPTWWKEWPCPLHPSWALNDISERDLNQLKLVVDTDDPERAVVESAIYRAFLEYPCGRFFNQGRANPTAALKNLELAEDQVEKKFHGSKEAEVGYGIVINSFRMWITSEFSKELHLQAGLLLTELITQTDVYPDYEYYIKVVQAYIYSRLGRTWQIPALSLYATALERFPDNCEWLYGKALMLGREARQKGFIKGFKHKDVQDACRKEKEILEKILNINPNFHAARALYGQVKFTLREKGAEKEIEKALHHEPERHSIVMVASRFYRRMKDFKKAEEILETYIKCATKVEADVYFQLGYLKCALALEPEVTLNESFELRREALTHFCKSAEINVCHYPALTKAAEVTALLGETTKAQEMFENLFEYVFKNKPYLAKEEMSSLDCALEISLPRDVEVFSTEKLVTLSHRYITLATEIDAVVISDGEDNCKVNKKIKERLKKLSVISLNKFEEECVRLLAMLKLADANWCLGNFREAKRLYEKVHHYDKRGKYRGETIWGLGKCYCSQGGEYLDTAITMASELERVDQMQTRAHELYADVYLNRAKSEMASKAGLSYDTKSFCSTALEHLEHAIDMGSLEACYVFLTKLHDLHSHYFSLELRIPEILAKIRLVCENITVRNVHTSFKVTLSDGSEISNDAMMKRTVIIEKVNKLFRFDINISENTCSSEEILDEYKQLELLRKTSVEFEYELLKRRVGENWNDECKEKLTEVLRIARVILDHVVHIYQALVLEKPPGRSLFAIQFDWKKAMVDDKLTREKLKKWISISFPGYIMPQATFDTILEVQPMYDKDNLWLAALGSFNSTVKHKGYVGGETFDLELKEAEWIRLKSEDIVRKSCQEVERLVLYFLSMFNTLKCDAESEHYKSQTNEEKGSAIKGAEEGEGVKKKLDGSKVREEMGNGRREKDKKGDMRSRKEEIRQERGDK